MLTSSTSLRGPTTHDREALARTRRSVREYVDAPAKWPGAGGERDGDEVRFSIRPDSERPHLLCLRRRLYLIDLKAASIVNVEATHAIRMAEVGAAPTMIVRTMDCFGIHPECLAADGVSESADMPG